MGQERLSAYDAGATDDRPPGGRDECQHANTRLLDEPHPRHVSGNHRWAGKRPVWCSDCKRVVDRAAP